MKIESKEFAAIVLTALGITEPKTGCYCCECEAKHNYWREQVAKVQEAIAKAQGAGLRATGL